MRTYRTPQIAVRLRAVVRRALALADAELAGGEDMVNRVLRIWADLTYVFEELP